MARTNQTFKAALKLNAEQFKKEAANVKKTLGSLKSSFIGFAGALGAGLGFGQLVGSMKRTAVELSVARATLENVSRETANFTDGINTASLTVDNFADNLKYLDGLAKKYKQDIVTLTDSFAKFSAAATTADIAIEEQKDIFRELTKAATFYHMSGERTQAMMVAIEQMFSKGKVTSEELRRQLGNNLPGAFGIMARAIGVSNAELDKMLKNGEVLAKDALPKFAKELSKITKYLNTDSLQLTQNELKNAWTNLVDSSGFENLYKKILKLTTWFINQLRTNVYTIIGLFGGMIGGAQLTKAFDKGLKEWDRYAKGVEKNINKLEKEYGRLAGGFKQKYGLDPVKDKAKIRGIGVGYNNQEMVKDYKTIIDVQKQIKTETNAINGITGKWQKAVNGIGYALKGVATTLKSALATFGFSAAIAAIGALVGSVIDFTKKIIEARREVKEFEEGFNKITEKASSLQEIEIEGWIRDLEKLYEKGEAGSAEWLEYLGKINELMESIGINEKITGNNLDDIKKKVGEWFDLLKKVEQFRYAARAEEQALEELADIQVELDKQSEKQLPNAFKVIRLYEQQAAAQKKLERARARQDETRTDYKQFQDKTKPKPEPKESDLSKVVKKQQQALKELENQYKAGALTESEYNDELADLIDKTFKAITAFDKFEEQLKSLGQSGWFEDIARQFALLKLAVDEEADALAYDAEMAERAADAYERFKDEQGKEKYQYAKIPNRGVRDVTFDYKKTQSGILGEEVDLTKEQIDYLTDAIEKAREKAKEGSVEAAIDLAYLTKQMKDLQGELTNLQDKMVMAELQEDIAKYQEKLFTTTASGIKNMATSLDRLVASTKSLMETLQDPDATAWEQIMGVFNQIIQVFDTIIGFVELFNTLSEISNSLGLAKNALEAKQVAIKEQGIAATELAMTTEQAQASQAVANLAALTAAQIIAKKAAIGSAVGGAVNSAMQLPYPENLAALASNMEALATALAAGEALQAFAKGGIVGGNSTTGDRNLVRANSGEMLLTKGQQGTLFSMLNGKGGVGGNVQFKIRGTDLIGVLSNENMKRRG